MNDLKSEAKDAALTAVFAVATIGGVAAFARAPNEAVPELVVRPACFYPVLQRRDFITLRGISFVNAGPDWAYPRAEQVGVVGTNWSRGWTVEDCEIAGSSCAGFQAG